MNDGLDHLIWKYLEGHCTDAEYAKVELKKLQDDSFSELLERSKVIHKTIAQKSLTSAPQGIESRVIKRVQALSHVYTKIIPKSHLLIFSAASILLIVTALLLKIPVSSQYEYLVDNYITDILPNLQMTLPGPLSSYMYVFCILISITILYLIDRQIQRRRVISTRVLP